MSPLKVNTNAQHAQLVFTVTQKMPLSQILPLFLALEDITAQWEPGPHMSLNVHRDISMTKLD